ncbi:MAG: hypothetical protein KDB18_12525 [Salinibacterium sp.]|nr:hypothetical protein [Salinibacterium sp.]
MKDYPDRGGRYGRRLYYEDDEFESIMDELRARADLGPLEPGRGVDVERVLKRAFDVEPDFRELPEHMLGRTEFQPDGQVAIEISHVLSELAEGNVVARRRLRSTLGHEGGHVALHRTLFLRDFATPSLFGDEPQREVSACLCRNEVIDAPSSRASGYHGEWWEYQANRAMSALLLPRDEVRREVPAVLARHGHADMDQALMAEDGVRVIRELSNIFDTSISLTLFRLQHLGFVPQDGRQQRLEWEVGRSAE